MSKLGTGISVPAKPLVVSWAGFLRALGLVLYLPEVGTMFKCFRIAMFFSWSMVLWFRRSWTIPKISLLVDPAEGLSPSCQRWKLSNLALFEPSDASLLEVLYHFFGMIDG